MISSLRSLSARSFHLRSSTRAVLALLAALPLVGCAGGPGETKTDTHASLRRFGSEQELVDYLAQVQDDSSLGGSPTSGVESGAAESSDSSSPAPPSNETITNNQEAGVDEGGIVKNIGDALVVLRKGRLYAVSVATPGAPQQTDSVAVAPSDALNQNVWYDEMLVKGDRIYVIGYRYGLQLEGETSDSNGGARGTAPPRSRASGCPPASSSA